MAHLITGSSGTPHITPKADAVWHRGLMGVESCILDYGEKLAPALVPSQPTNIRILDGCGMMQGRFFEIEEGSYDTIAIPNGAQGYNRIDLVCAKITQNENGTQTFSWEVVQGTQTSGTPQPPTVAEGSLDDGDEFALMPIASVRLESVNIVAVETVATISKTVKANADKIEAVYYEEGSSGNWKYKKYADGTLECWGNFPFSSVSSAGVVGGFNYAVITSTPDFPVAFSAEPTVSVGQFKWGSGLFLANVVAVSTSKVNTLHIYSTNVGDKAGYYGLYAIGRWN